jgi:hypothetical protein
MRLHSDAELCQVFSRYAPWQDPGNWAMCGVVIPSWFALVVQHGRVFLLVTTRSDEDVSLRRAVTTEIVIPGSDGDLETRNRRH